MTVFNRIIQATTFALVLAFTQFASAAETTITVTPTYITPTYLSTNSTNGTFTYKIKWNDGTSNQWLPTVRYKVSGSTIVNAASATMELYQPEVTISGLQPGKTYVIQLSARRSYMGQYYYEYVNYKYGKFGEASDVATEPVLQFTVPTVAPAPVPSPTPYPLSVLQASTFKTYQATCDGWNTLQPTTTYNNYNRLKVSVTLSGPMAAQAYANGVWSNFFYGVSDPKSSHDTQYNAFYYNNRYACPSSIKVRNKDNTNTVVTVPVTFYPIGTVVPTPTPFPEPDTTQSTFNKPTFTCGGYNWATIKPNPTSWMYIDESVNGGPWAPVKSWDKQYMFPYDTRPDAGIQVTNKECPTTLKFRNSRNTAIVADVAIIRTLGVTSGSTVTPTPTPAPTATPTPTPTPTATPVPTPAPTPAPTATPSLSTSTFTSYSATCTSTKLITVTANLSGAMYVQRYFSGSWTSFGGSPSPAGAFVYSYQGNTSYSCPSSIRIRNKDNTSHTVTVTIQRL